MMETRAIIVSAPSGAGKTTIVRHLLNHVPDLVFSISATSRKKRERETDGEDYFFISEAEFKEKIGQDELLEWEEVYPGSFYGTLKSEVNRVLDNQKHIIFDVDVVGGLNIKMYFGDRALSIFVKPPTVESLEQRLRCRASDTDEVINKRLLKAAWEMEFADKFDYILINDSLQKAKEEALETVTKFLNP